MYIYFPDNDNKFFNHPNKFLARRGREGPRLLPPP
jgi:hypothetical protein